MLKLPEKLYSTTIWNTSAAGLNFLTNLLIVRIFGLPVFGELAYISSIAALFSLVFIILPGNYSLVRYQDDPEFKYLLAAFYLTGSILIAILSLVFAPMVHLHPVWLFLLACSLAFQGFFDISLQAENKLNFYFFLLFLISVVKALFVGLFYLADAIHSLQELVMLLALSQSVVMGSMTFRYGKIFWQSPAYLKRLFRLIWQERRLLSGYYFNTGLKKLNANILVLLFEPWISKEILGTFALFLKVHQFITGLVRTLESFFINRISRIRFASLKGSRLLVIGIWTQLIYLFVGGVYLKYLTGYFFLTYLLFYSLTIYPYLWYIQARAEFLIGYRNKPINLSYFIFLVIACMIFVLFRTMPGWNGLVAISTAFVTASTLQMLSLIGMQQKWGFQTSNSSTRRHE